MKHSCLELFGTPETVKEEMVLFNKKHFLFDLEGFFTFSVAEKRLRTNNNVGSQKPFQYTFILLSLVQNY